jgi:hypothetical protein
VREAIDKLLNVDIWVDLAAAWDVVVVAWLMLSLLSGIYSVAWALRLGRIRGGGSRPWPRYIRCLCVRFFGGCSFARLLWNNIVPPARTKAAAPWAIDSPIQQIGPRYHWKARQ